MIKFTLKLLFNYNLHVGYNKGRWNPNISVFLLGIRNNVHIINLTNTLYMLKKVSFFIEQVIVNFGVLLFINNIRFGLTNFFFKNLLIYGQHFVNRRYSGGLLTNFKNVKVKYKSLKKMFRLPSIVFVGSVSNIIPVYLECKKLNVPLIGVCDSNIDPAYFNYPIPGNNGSLLAIKFYYKFICESVFHGILKKRILFRKQRNIKIFNKKSSFLSSRLSKFKKRLLKY